MNSIVTRNKKEKKNDKQFAKTKNTLKIIEYEGE